MTELKPGNKGSVESRDYLELTFRSINCFANDGKLDEKELDELMTIALRDGEIDENEKRVLNNIFDRLNARDLNDSMQAKINEIRSSW